MTRVKSFLSILCLLFAFALHSQVVYTDPALVYQSTPNVTVYFNSAEGNKGLKDYTGDVYAHTGVITSKSASGEDWKHAPTWGDNSPKYKLTNVGTNLWMLQIPDINAFYGITDASETVKRLAFVFRSGDKAKEGKGAGNTNLFIDVYEPGLAMEFSSDASSRVVTSTNNVIKFSIATSQDATLSLYVKKDGQTSLSGSATGTTYSQTVTLPEIGNYEVMAKAETSAKTLWDTIPVCYRGDSKVMDYAGELKQGATRNADGSVTFCLFAPMKSNVMLVGEWDDYAFSHANVMNCQGDKYFWMTVPAEKIDKTKSYGYYFLVDDATSVADPYARLISDPWDDKYINEKATVYPGLRDFPSEKVEQMDIAVLPADENRYEWTATNFKRPSKENLIIYELLFRDFTVEGTVAAAMEKLDYLKELGINAIELMPIMEFSGNNSWGYNPNFYFAPDKAYGDATAYKTFIDQCHKRGIAVILDIVLNHSWGEHPWCKMYWDAANQRPSADNPFFNAIAPHNWNVGNDWKQENTSVQDYFCDVLKYWIDEYHVDGYRFDLAKGLGASDSYSADYDASKYNASRIAILKKYTDAVKSAGNDAYAIYEYFVDKSEENEMGNYGGMSWKKMNNAYAQAAMGFSESSAFTGMYSGDESRPFGSIVGYMESHDEERIAYKQANFGTTAAKLTANAMRRLSADAAFMLLVPGAKMIWQFGEMGYDISGGNGDTSAKTPHWEYLNDDYNKGLHDCYQELLNFRKTCPDLFSADAQFSWNVAESNWNFGRTLSSVNTLTGRKMVAVFNPTTSSLTVTSPVDLSDGTFYIVSASYKTAPAFNASTSKITVPAHGYVLIANIDMSGIDGVAADAAGKTVTVYPNPASDYIKADADDVSLMEIYSISGVLSEKAENPVAVDVSTLAAGSYIVKMTHRDGTVSTARLLKK